MKYSCQPSNMSWPLQAPPVAQSFDHLAPIKQQSLWLPERHNELGESWTRRSAAKIHNQEGATDSRGLCRCAGTRAGRPAPPSACSGLCRLCCRRRRFAACSPSSSLCTHTADLFALLKTTEKLERAYVRDAIPPKEYEPACERLIGQYRTLWETVRGSVSGRGLVGHSAGG